MSEPAEGVQEMTERSEVVLGQKYRDRITGFTGVATSRHEYLNGCVRIALTSAELHEGKPVDAVTFDIEDLVFVDEGVTTNKKPTGGPGDIPKPRFEPRGERR